MLSWPETGCDVGAGGFAIDVAPGCFRLGLAPAEGNAARVDAPCRVQQPFGQAGRVRVVPGWLVLRRHGDEQALVAAPDVLGEMEAGHLRRRLGQPCCIDLGCGRSCPSPGCGSGDADADRASRRQHAVEDVDGDIHLGRRRRSVRECSPLPITCLNLPMAASARARIV